MPLDKKENKGGIKMGLKKLFKEFRLLLSMARRRESRKIPINTRFDRKSQVIETIKQAMGKDWKYITEMHIYPERIDITKVKEIKKED